MPISPPRVFLYIPKAQLMHTHTPPHTPGPHVKIATEEQFKESTALPPIISSDNAFSCFSTRPCFFWRATLYSLHTREAASTQEFSVSLQTYLGFWLPKCSVDTQRTGSGRLPSCAAVEERGPKSSNSIRECNLVTFLLWKGKGKQLDQVKLYIDR